MKNIHVLPTNKPSKLATHYEKMRLIQTPDMWTYEFTKQNLYITSDEEIKEGNYYITILDNEVYKATKETQNIMSVANLIGTTTYKNTHFKIILTTDQDLIKNGVQAIDDEFLEWFVKNPSCESVEVDESPITNDPKGYKSFYKIIIPQKEPKQDRTCTNNCSVVCGECQIFEFRPMSGLQWLLGYIEELNKKGYRFIPSSNKEIVEHVTQMEKDNMINFLKYVFQQDGFDYEKAYNNFLKQQI